MHDKNDGNGWSKYEHYVLSGLDRLEQGIQSISSTIDNHVEVQNHDFTQIKLDIHDLKTKIGVWAAIIVAVGAVVSPVVSDLVTHYLVR